jgi:hypothetical protein
MAKRFNMTAQMECGVMVDVMREDERGLYMLAADYDALAARLAEADKANQLLRADLSAAAREEDLILTALRLDPERYRTECGYLNVPKIIAAIRNPDQYPRLADSASFCACDSPAAMHRDGWCTSCGRKRNESTVSEVQK